MTTVIDALIVELSLDPSKFNKGQAEAVDSLRKMETEAKKRGGEVEKAAAGIEQGFAAVQKRLLGVAALLLGGLGIEQFIQKITKLQVATANLGSVLGISSQSLQTWSMAAERFGVSGPGVQAGIGGIARQQYSFQNGNPSAFGLFNMSLGTRGGRNPLMINPWADSTESILMKTAGWLENSRRKPQDIEALRQAGVSEDLITLLSKGTKALKETLNETKKLAPTDAEIQRFKDLNKAFEEAAQNASLLGRKLTQDLAPGLVKFFNLVSKVINVLAPFFGGQEKHFNSPEDAAAELSRRRHGGSDETRLRRLEDQLHTTQSNLATAQGIYRKPLENEIKRLTDEIAKLREQMRSSGGLQNQSFIGGFGAAGDNARLIQTAFSGGGAASGGVPTIYGSLPRSERDRGDSSGRGGGIPEYMGGAGQNAGIDRTKWREELLNNPALRERFYRHALGENSDPLANQAVMEEAANRADIRGNRRFADNGNLSYFQGYYRGKITPKLLKMLDDNFRKVFIEGSDVSHGAIDNSSGWLAAKHKRTGAFQTTFEHGGETFQIPGTRESGHGERARYPEFRRRQLRQIDEAKRARAIKEGGTPIPSPAPGRGDQSWNDSLINFASYGFGGAGSSSSQSFQIGDIHVHRPVGSAEDLASNVRGNVRRMAQIISANNGPA